MKEVPQASPEILNQAIRRAVLVEASQRPKLPADINAILVLGGGGTYFKPLKDSEATWQRYMDRNRIRTAVKLMGALEISRFAPFFVYNGSPDENRDFKKALATGQIKLPGHKVIILDEVEEGQAKRPITNTHDQIASFYQELGKWESPLHACRNVVLVSHSPHFIRIPHYIRLFEQDFLQTHGRIISYWAYGVKSESAVFNEFVRSELNKLTSYVNCCHLNPAPTPHLTIA